MIENLYSFYKSRCEQYRDCILFDNTITYGRAFDLAMSRAAFLQEKGYRTGDVIGILAGSSAEWCITYMSINITGAIVLPLDTNLPPESYASMLEKVNARAVFVSDQFSGIAKGTASYSIDLNKCMGEASSVEPAHVGEDHIASLVFTSGTTGNPKIVTLSHRNIFRTAISTSEYLELGPGDMNLCILPLFHVYALDANFIGPFAAGGALVFQPSLKGPDIMQSLAENPITIFPAAPQLWELFADGIINRVRSQSKIKYRLFMFFLKAATLLKSAGMGFLVRKIFSPVHDIFGRSHRFFISGGAPLKKKYIRYYRNMGFTLIEGYGLTETTGPITLPDYKKNVPGSVGKPTPGNFVKIKNVNRDGIGEVWLGGDSVMAGYYQNDSANREAFDSDRFFNTGDLGRLDKKGNLFLTGRSKNVIVLDSGKNVYPEELESYYKQSDLIQEIAVFGKTVDGRETAYAVIVPAVKSPESFTAVRDEIQRLNRGLPGYKTISGFAISFDTLPVNSTRKVLYSEVIKNLDSGMYQVRDDERPVLSQTLTAVSQKEEIIISALQSKLGREVLYANQTFSDFELDSLGLIDLIVYLEQKVGVDINSASVMKLQTIQELVQYIATCEESTGVSLEERIFKGDITTQPHRIFNPLHHIILTVFSIISKMLWGLRTEHRERMVFDNNIIVANHQSYLDIVWVASELPARYRKDIYVTGKKKLSFLKFIFPIFPVIFIEEENTLPSLKAGADILRLGKSLIIFPEGTRSRTGEVDTFKTGAAYLSKNLNKKIIPISISGAYDIYPPHRIFPKIFTGNRGKLTIGEIINPEDYSTIEELNNAIRASVEKNIDRTINNK
ncbi:MAG TPA: AMP-binding protein [Spirochaetota bacterium]|nr:AMP-binding protein [Spirochaetota bacterium]